MRKTTLEILEGHSLENVLKMSFVQKFKQRVDSIKRIEIWRDHALSYIASKTSYQKEFLKLSKQQMGDLIDIVTAKMYETYDGNFWNLYDPKEA